MKVGVSSLLLLGNPHALCIGMGEIIINYVGPAPNEYLKLNVSLSPEQGGTQIIYS